MSKVWFITGSSSGFGKELCRVALEHGDHVIATARKTDDLSDLVEEYGEKVLAVSLDVTKQESVDSAVKEGIAWKGRIDVLVNNAGIGCIGAVEEQSLEDMQFVFDVNVWGLLRVTKALLPQLREQKSGHIINISSIAGLLTMAGFGAYCATKHAVESFTDALGAELEEHGISVTSVEPGAFRTKFVGHNLRESPEMEVYANTAGQTRQFLQQMAETAQGDPVKGALHMYKMAQLETLPRRFPLGEDSWEWATNRVEELKGQLFANEALSRNTNFD